MPEYSETLGDVAVEMMDAYGLTLDEWQANIQRDWLAFGDDGKFAASICGLSVPRQNGKTANVQGRVIVGISVLNETILYTAHEVKTARKTFEEMCGMFDPNGAYPDLAAQVDYIRRANGQEEIKLQDWQDDDGEWQRGGRVIFSARSRGASRGFTADVLICDEAQELTDEQMAALMPVISSGRKQNSQTILIGTPPSPICPAEVFKSTREQALSDEPGRTCWHEWSVDEIGDVRDWSRVEATNPALDLRLMRANVEAEMAAMAPDFFARERLGHWSRQSTLSVIDEKEWKACATAERPSEGVYSYAVKFSYFGDTCTVGTCLKSSDDAYYVGVAQRFDMGDGMTQIVDFVCGLKDKAARVTVDGGSNVQPFIDELIRRGFPKRAIWKARPNHVASACSAFLSAIREKGVHHFDQESLNDSALKSKRRKIGSDGWGFGDNDCDATVIESCAIAYWGALSAKKVTTRKQRMAF